MKKVRVILSLEAKEIYQYLIKTKHGKVEQSILRALQQKVDFLKENMHYGNPIAKKLIPSEYRIKYKVTNLFRIELPNYWRLLYTITQGDTPYEIIAFVLEITNHQTYNLRFGYKKF